MLIASDHQSHEHVVPAWADGDPKPAVITRRNTRRQGAKQNTFSGTLATGPMCAPGEKEGDPGRLGCASNGISSERRDRPPKSKRRNSVLINTGADVADELFQSLFETGGQLCVDETCARPAFVPYVITGHRLRLRPKRGANTRRFRPSCRRRHHLVLNAALAINEAQASKWNNSNMARQASPRCRSLPGRGGPTFGAVAEISGGVGRAGRALARKERNGRTTAAQTTDAALRPVTAARERHR